MKVRWPLSVEVVRGQVVESQHQVMAVVVDDRGAPALSWGNLDYLTYPRSAIKMLQALPLVESGAADAFGFEDRHLCLTCSSHRGERKHLLALKEILKKTGIHEDQLVCGPHWPAHEASTHDMIREGLVPTALTNNCSGKHSGIIATCLHLKENPLGYETFAHPAQARLRRVLSEVMHFDHEKTFYGVDGCGIPTYAVPLKNLAIGMLALINPKESEARRLAGRRIIEAVRKEAFYLSGSDDFTSDFIRGTQGRCIIKNGAEGVFCGVIPEKGWAFAVKAEDGGARAAQAATAFLLEKLGVIKEENHEELKKYLEPKVKNWKGLEVGSIRVRMPVASAPS